MKKITSRDFRSKMSHILNQITSKLGEAFEIGESRNNTKAILLSEQSLQKYKERFIVNNQIYTMYQTLALDDYLTLLQSPLTKELPPNIRVALSDWFKLSYVLVEDMNNATTSINILDEPIHQYFQSYSPYDMVTGRIHYIVNIQQSLLKVDANKIDDSTTIYDYYQIIHANMENQSLTYHSDVYDLDTTIYHLIDTAIQTITKLMIYIIQYQDITDYSRPPKEDIMISFIPVLNWYDTNIATEEHMWIFNGIWRYNPLN